MIDRCSAESSKPGNFVEAQSRKTRLMVDCEAACAFKYSRSAARLFCISGLDE